MLPRPSSKQLRFGVGLAVGGRGAAEEPGLGPAAPSMWPPRALSLQWGLGILLQA